jgi:hypothetical protein
VHREIDLAAQQRLLDLADEDAAAPRRQRARRDAVALGGDDRELHVEPGDGAAQRRGYLPGLRQRQPAAAGPQRDPLPA